MSLLLLPLQVHWPALRDIDWWRHSEFVRIASPLIGPSSSCAQPGILLKIDAWAKHCRWSQAVRYPHPWNDAKEEDHQWTP